MNIDVPASATQTGSSFNPPRKVRPWFTSVAAPPGATSDETHQLTRERIHRAVGTGMKRSGWFAAAAVFDIGNRYDTTYFGAPDRERAYLVLATAKWRQRWTKTRIDPAIMPCSADELAYYAQPVSAEIARYAFEKYSPCATYKIVLGYQGAYVDTLATWGQQ